MPSKEETEWGKQFGSRVGRRDASTFYEDILVPKIRSGEELDPAKLRELINAYQKISLALDLI